MPFIRVRKLDKRDLGVRADWFNDPSIYTQMTFNIPVSQGDMEQWYAKLDYRHRSDLVFEWMASDDAEPELISMGGVTSVDYVNSHAELYLMMKPGYAGKGMGRIIFFWMCNYAFHMFNLNRIYGYQYEVVDKWRKVLEKNGWHTEGRMRGHVLHNGSYQDKIIVGILRDEWEQQSWKTDPPISLRIDLDE